MGTAGGGSFGHKDGPKQAAISCSQGEESWKLWKAGTYGNVSLSDGIIEYAKTHEEIKGAFLTFQKDADQIYPGWKEQLGYTGESSVQAASFDWKKRAGAAMGIGEAFIFEKPSRSYYQQEFGNDVGYLPDGTPMNRAGNDVNHPETIRPDPHVSGSDLPRALFVNDINHPERIGPDPHVAGSPLPPPFRGYANDIGYLPDGTDMALAGNLMNH